MDDGDLVLRNLTYALFADLGRAPTAAEVAGAADLSEAQVQTCWKRLHDAHALVLDHAGRIRMANPFSRVPTAYRVRAAGRWWFGNCAWDAFGICAPCSRTEGSRPSVLTAASRCGSRYAISVPMTTACSSVAWSPPGAGGMTSVSLEPR